LVGELVEAARVPALDAIIAIRTLDPRFQVHQPRRDFIEVGRALDRIRNRREEHVGVGLLDVLDRRLDVRNLFALVAPHQEHACLDASLLREPHRGLHFVDGDSAFHAIEDALRSALGADPNAEAA
jgi:hypothetical protein